MSRDDAAPAGGGRSGRDPPDCCAWAASRSICTASNGIPRCLRRRVFVAIPAGPAAISPSALPGSACRQLSSPRWGGDPMGDYLLSALECEGVATDAVRRGPERRTALAFLGMLDAEAVNLDFYREFAADVAILDGQVPQARLEECEVLAVTGTLAAAATPGGETLGIVARALATGVRLVVDIDFRQAIWEKAPGGLEGATARVRNLPDMACLVVGNEEEFRVMPQAGRLEDAVASLRNTISAPLVVKLEARGSMWIDENSPVTFAEIPVEPGFAVDVVNPVGAGDSFLAGFLASWLNGGLPGTALRRGNACGAIVVSRHGCSAASPYRQELDLF